MRASRVLFALLLGVAIAGATLGLVGKPAWRPRAAAGPIDALASVSTAPPGERFIADVPNRETLRWCCALGIDMRIDYMGVTLPVSVGDILDIEQLGSHHYDGGGAMPEFASVIDAKLGDALPGVERNGLVYTCHGGVIDTSHIRELVDWTAYFQSQFDQNLELGTTLEIAPEGASRRMILSPVPADVIERFGRADLVRALGKYAAYQTSIWHEVAQWYGFSILTSFPETNSGFSPDDPFSNAVGITLLDPLDLDAVLATEEAFNRAVDQRTIEVLDELVPMPADVTREVVEALDGLWWTSQVHLPRKEVIQRRYFEHGESMTPWLLPRGHTPPALAKRLDERCGPDPEPHTIALPSHARGVAFRDYVTFEVTMDGHLAQLGLPALDALPRRMTQDDLPRLVEQVRQEAFAEFGPRADLRD